MNKNISKQVLSSNNELESINDQISRLENEIEKITFADIVEYISNKVNSLEQNASFSFNLFTTRPTISVHHSGVGKFYFAYSQYRKLECEYKESNKKRIVRFDYHSKLNVNLDIAVKEAKIKLSHDFQHEKPIDITTPEEIKNEIIQNLYIDSVQL
ncbi:9781_t:CDS:2 [Scutellospora calospora]|uniref:9781_t:CDS:1 n=1 Tax=Scutellospora calospora TaxID=85575 RepID=A0ACA9KR46_9GLOM|nr:9781_t:CDS:2 [Scutellospora calospora]